MWAEFVIIWLSTYRACHGACGEYFDQSPGEGIIQSPNYGYEYGRSANCWWKFYPFEGYALLLNLTNLFYSYEGSCDGYSLTFSTSVSPIENYCAQRITLANAQCFTVYDPQSSCSRLKKLEECSDDGNTNNAYGYMWVRYYSDGRKIAGNQPTNIYEGFRMTYEYVECEIDSSNTESISSAVSSTPATRHQSEYGSSASLVTSHMPKNTSSYTTTSSIQSNNQHNVTISVLAGTLGIVIGSVIIAAIVYLRLRMKKKSNTKKTSNQTENAYDDTGPSLEPVYYTIHQIPKSDGGYEVPLPSAQIKIKETSSHTHLNEIDKTRSENTYELAADESCEQNGSERDIDTNYETLEKVTDKTQKD